MKTKKGGLLDLVIAITIAFVLGIALVLFTFAQNKVEEQMYIVAPTLQEDFPSVNVTQVIDSTIGDVTRAYTSFKWISVMLIFGLFLSILISSFVVRTHPVWFVGYIFIVVISIIISVYISNTYEQLMSDTTLANIFLTGFFAQNWIFLNFPVWFTVFGILGAILLYINMDTGGVSY